MHRNVSVYSDHENEWFVEFETPCVDLQQNHDCGRYDTRPQICRDHGWPAGSGEFFENPVKILFRTPAEFEAYLDREKFDFRWKRRPKTAQATADCAE